MNLPSVSRSGKPWISTTSTDKVPLHVAQTSIWGHGNPSPEIKPSDHDTASVYSDAGDTLASRPSNATSCEDIHRQEDPVRCSNPDSRDFILKRFLPAAQAMAETGSKSSTSTSSQHRLQKHSSARLTPSKRRSEEGLVGDEENNIKACGFPLHLGRLTLQHLRYSFWSTTTSRSTSSKPPLPPTTSKASQKVVQTQEEASDDSDDLFWSDEELGQANDRNIGAEATPSASEMRKRLATELLIRPARLHSMETVHTPDHRGFLGLPKTTKSTTTITTGQVDRLGARLSRMITKTNYMDPPRVVVEEAASSSQTSTATSSSSTTTTTSVQASLVPPPSPKMPSESWLSSALPPEKLMEVKRMSRKSLGSFIPIKPHRAEEARVRLRQSCSLKEHLQGRYEV